VGDGNICVESNIQAKGRGDLDLHQENKQKNTSSGIFRVAGALSIRTWPIERHAARQRKGIQVVNVTMISL
jgi:hypothetical protein